MDIFAFALLLTIVGLVGYVILAYNRLVRLRHNVKTAWSNIDVLLKQRHDELPKLVTTCRQYMTYERDTLERVVQARAQVSSAMDSGNMAELGVAESIMSNTLGRLFALTESYPELKSDGAFMRLQSRISSLEDAIADRREYYNDSVNINNIVVDEFPTNIISGKFNFSQAQHFEVSERELADVNLDKLFAA
ncbi:LemA family protein [Chromatiales bacterium (ex Bugula neritina AB1)]|nr:LemA family protein [Chromatiales bacterium (ex Bugula neritina AB1)]